MKLIIEISEEDYNFLIEHKDEYNYERTRIAPILNSIPLNECEAEDCISRKRAQDEVYWKCQRWSLSKASNGFGQDVWNDYMISSKDAMQVLKELSSVYPKNEDKLSDGYYRREYLRDLGKDIYHELCKEVHHYKECPCTNQTTSCLANIRVCDADRAIGKVIDRKIAELSNVYPKNDNSVLEEIKNELIARMWNWRSKNTPSIDKVAMEIKIRDVIDSHISRKE